MLMRLPGSPTSPYAAVVGRQSCSFPDRGEPVVGAMPLPMPSFRSQYPRTQLELCVNLVTTTRITRKVTRDTRRSIWVYAWVSGPTRRPSEPYVPVNVAARRIESEAEKWVVGKIARDISKKHCILLIRCVEDEK